MSWSRLPPEELERRRLASVEATKQRDREAFDRWYQEQCDRDYWTRGQCCAGCDHWRSDMGRIGECRASGLVPGGEVMATLGIMFCSAPLSPGFPLTRDDWWCGMFRDDFDWSTLDARYLERIGAMRNGKLKPKPRHVRAV